jgi:hypothetical protein
MSNEKCFAARAGQGRMVGALFSRRNFSNRNAGVQRGTEKV